MARKKSDESRNNALVALLDNDNEPMSRTDLGLSIHFVKDLLQSGHIKEKGTRKHLDDAGKPRAGRPQKLYALTPNGRKAAKRNRPPTEEEVAEAAISA